MKNEFISFDSWADLHAHIRAGYTTFYQAPFDQRPSVVQTAIRKDGKIRVTPVYTDCDPFTADTGHLDRFRRLPRNA